MQGDHCQLLLVTGGTLNNDPSSDRVTLNSSFVASSARMFTVANI
jgi:hypothetical protein